MLSTMRRRVRLIMIIVAVAFVAGFLMSELWQLIRSRERGRPSRRAGAIGEIDREPITIEQYRQAREFISRRFQRDSLFRDFTADDEARIDKLAWDYLTSELIWARLLKKTRLNITDGEIEWIITNVPPQELTQRSELQTDGQFDTAKYHQLLRVPENQPFFASYAREIFEQLRQQKLQLYAMANYRITNAELTDIQRRANRTAVVTALRFRPPRELPEPTDEEARAWYKAHPEQFRAQKEVREVRWVRVPISITQQDSLDAQQRIEQAYQRIRAADTASFRDSLEMAMLTDGDYQPDTAPVRFLRSELDPRTDSLIRRLKPGQFTLPYQTVNGWQITVLDSIRQDTVFIRRIRTRIKPDNTREIAALDLARAVIELANATSLDSAARANNLTVGPMPVMIVGGELSRPPGTLYAPGQLTEWATHARKGEVMDVPLRGSDGYYIFALTNITPAQTRPFDEQTKQAAKWRVRAEKANQQTLAAARQAFQELRAGRRLEEFAQEHPDEVEATHDTINGIFDYRVRAMRGVEFVAAALALEPGQTCGPIQSHSVAYIIRCDTLLPAVSPYSDSIYSQERQQQIFQAIWQSLWKQPQIKDYRATTPYY
ncbi:MAG: peptidyl-prolyl cis-trans isomerase [candidate division WOR-3 bacterium]